MMREAPFAACTATEGTIRPGHPCSVAGCPRPALARDLCRRHYQAWRRNGDPVIRRRRGRRTCSSEGCALPVRSHGLCGRHDEERRRRALGKRKNRPYGSGSITEQGYRLIYKPGHPNATRAGLILEHRWVMSTMLGRPLRKNEEVHHRNGDRQDNGPDNLELWSTSQPKGQRIEEKLKWAREIVAIYSPPAVELDDLHYW